MQGAGVALAKRHDVTSETSPPADPADARVAELTAALTAARRELETLRVAHADLRRTHEEMRSSNAFKLAERIWAVRNAVRRGVRR
jgi:hypothetical protein